MFLWNGDEKNDRGPSDGSDWIRSVMGLDGILNQPNMLVGWISGQAARLKQDRYRPVSRLLLDRLLWLLWLLWLLLLL